MVYQFFVVLDADNYDISVIYTSASSYSPKAGVNTPDFGQGDDKKESASLSRQLSAIENRWCCDSVKYAWTPIFNYHITIAGQKLSTLSFGTTNPAHNVDVKGSKLRYYYEPRVTWLASNVVG